MSVVTNNESLEIIWSNQWENKFNPGFNHAESMFHKLIESRFIFFGHSWIDLGSVKTNAGILKSHHTTVATLWLVPSWYGTRA